MRVSVRGLGLVAPGLTSWEAARPVLGGETAYLPEPLPKLVPQMLPANERRRTTAVIKLALQAGSEAMSGAEAAAPAAVFASSDGDLEIVDRLCSALALPERPVSPTHFHNSVHNAPAGYWSIASGNTAPSTSLSAYRGSFAAGLLEAAVMCTVEARPTLLVAYDHPAPPLLDRVCPMASPFASAWLLLPETARDMPVLQLNLAGAETGETYCADTALEALRRGNPAARALPLLEAVARGGETRVRLPYLDDMHLEVACRS